MKSKIKYLNLKLIIFVQIMTLLVCGLMHMFSFIIGNDFKLNIYLIFSGLYLGLTLIALYVIIPLIEWVFETES